MVTNGNSSGSSLRATWPEQVLTELPIHQPRCLTICRACMASLCYILMHGLVDGPTGGHSLLPPLGAIDIQVAVSGCQI